jgi:hypothetical protein
MLILYPATLLKVFISSKNFLVEFLRSFKYRIIVSTRWDNLTFSFPISFSYFTKDSSTALNKSGELDTLVLFLNVEEMLSASPHLV